MVATLVLETSAERRVGSSPTWGTKLREWCKGSHRRLKISRLRACGFDSRLSHQIRAGSLKVKQATHNRLSDRFKSFSAHQQKCHRKVAFSFPVYITLLMGYPMHVEFYCPLHVALV